jgi:hypothetical protein
MKKPMVMASVAVESGGRRWMMSIGGPSLRAKETSAKCEAVSRSSSLSLSLSLSQAQKSVIWCSIRNQFGSQSGAVSHIRL